MQTLDRTEAAMLAALLRPRIQLLTEFLAAQVQSLPPGDDSWCDTEQELQLAAGTLQKLEARP